MQTDPHTHPALTVSELNREAKNLLERHFDWVWVEGEISQFTAASSGHWYFSLKDTGAQVRCAMFRRANGRAKLQPKMGDSVRIRARVTLYEGRGEFQLVCEHIEAAGVGALQVAFEQLKARLSEEGLFASEHKQSIPHDAEHVGIVTSATGAALQDILTILERRSPHTRVYVFPVPVQGDGAAERIADAIHQADQLARAGKIRIDVLIVGRGGGSPEDLWAFNEEVVARALFAASVPNVSAVGHEIDFSIADLVADTRAATPSAAAELVSIDQNEWLQQLDQLSGRLNRAVGRSITELTDQLSALQKRIRHPGYALTQHRKTLLQLSGALQRTTERYISARRAKAEQLMTRLTAQHPQQQLLRHRSENLRQQHRLLLQIKQKLQSVKSQALYQHKLLQSLGPEQTLNRGYAIVTDAQGNVIRNASSKQPGDDVSIRLKEGKLIAEVTGHAPD
jgi:exodeoxyribonuclease VII large subunit